MPLALGVMQILMLDIGTDTLSATALWAEPPGTHLLRGPPVAGRLLNNTVLRRAFGVLGPTVAVASLSAFVASLVAAGWRPGDDFPKGPPLAAASGAAFIAVVLGEMARLVGLAGAGSLLAVDAIDKRNRRSALVLGRRPPETRAAARPHVKGARR